MVVRRGSVCVVACYLPPSWNLAEYEAALDAVAGVIRRQRPTGMLIAGDFNAWSQCWGSPRTNARGRLVEEWADELGLCLANIGKKNTFKTCRRGGLDYRFYMGLPGTIAETSGLKGVWCEDSL